MKWFFPKNNAYRVKTTAARNKKWLLLTVFASLFAVATISLLAPKTSYADVSYNKLQLIGEHCHDLDNITYNFKIGNDGWCHQGSEHNFPGWQEVLNETLGCSDTMFYQHDNQIDDDDASVTQTRWYTKQGDYKDCWNKAQDMQNAMTTPEGQCSITKDGSDNFKKCQEYQDKMHDALGCDSSMFQSIADDKWKVKPAAAQDCQKRIDDVGKQKLIVIANNGKPIENPDPIKSDTVAATDPNDDGNGGDPSDLACDFSGSPLSWVICPVVNLMTKAITATDKIITDQMALETQSIFCTRASGADDSCQAYYSAWSTFRNIALGLLVVAGLIIVIAQAMGTEILDAYTIRKALPKLLIAAIAITLSWTLMNFAVTLSNNLGYGIRDLILSPFHSFSTTIHIDFWDGSLINKLLGAGAIAAAIPVWIAFGGIGVLLSFVATAGLAVLIAILVLIIREIVIIMLILLSPIAIIAYVFPNTQRVFRLWWESFSKALLMFPLIAAFIATGRVVAAISLQKGDVVSGIIAFVAYFGPYFLIPLTLRLSGGIMSGVGGVIQQRGQGIGQALGGYRTNQRQQRVQRARTEGLYRPNFGKFKVRPGGKQRSVGGMLNTTGFWGLNADEMIPMKLGTTTMMGMKKKPGIPGFRRGGYGLESEIMRAKRDQTLQGAQDLDIGYKSGRLMAGEFQYYHSGLTSEGHQMLDDKFGVRDDKGNFQGYKAPETWGERMKAAEIFTEHTKGQDPVTGEWDAKGIEAREAGTELKATASEFEKYTKSPETNRVDGRLLGLVSAAKAGRLEMEDVANNHNSLLREGHHEQAVRETTILQDALTPKRVSAARGHSIWYDTDGEAHSSYEDPTSAKAQTSLMRINTQEIAGSKSEDVDALRETLVAGASKYQMQYDPKIGQVRAKVGEDKTKPSYGHALLKDPDSDEGRRVKEIRGRIKTLAMYNSGDSDVGRKIRDIWVDRLQLPEDELEWGGRGHSSDPYEAMLATGAMGPKPEPPPAPGSDGAAPHP